MGGDVAAYIVLLEKLTVIEFQHCTCIAFPVYNLSIFSYGHSRPTSDDLNGWFPENCKTGAGKRIAI